MGVTIRQHRGQSRNQTGLEMSVDLFSMPVGQGARFWSNYMSALKGVQDLHVPEDDHVKTYYPSIMETIPPTHPEIRREVGKLESLIMSQPRGKTRLTPVIGGATDRVQTTGYRYCPVHTEVYGTYLARDRLGGGPDLVLTVVTIFGKKKIHYFMCL